MGDLAYSLRAPIFSERDHKAYSEVIAREFYSGDFTARQAAGPYEFRLERGLCYPISIFSFNTSVHTSVRRTQAHIRADKADVYLVWLLSQGSLRISDSTGTKSVTQGYMAIIPSRIPRLLETLPLDNASFSAAIAVLPAHLFRPHLADVSPQLGTSYCTSSGEGRVIRDLATLLYDEGDRIERSTGGRLVDQLLRSIGHMAKSSCPLAQRRQTIRETRFRDIDAYIDLHLSDPDINSHGVALKCGISQRYLYHLFKEEGTTFSEVLWKKRLSKAGDWLQMAEMRHYSISEIAAIVGFRNNAHFSRSFRNVFAMTAREWRKQPRKHSASSGERSCLDVPFD